jgi:hypothetical protein
VIILNDAEREVYRALVAEVGEEKAPKLLDSIQHALSGPMVAIDDVAGWIGKRIRTSDWWD